LFAHDVYLYDRATGGITLVSHSATSPTTGGNAPSGGLVMSADGSTIAYTSKATNLVSGFVPSNYKNAEEAYRFDRATQTTTLMSHTYSTATKGAYGRFIVGSISDDGGYTAFSGAPLDLFQGGTPTDPGQVWLNDRLTNGNILISHAFTS